MVIFYNKYTPKLLNDFKYICTKYLAHILNIYICSIIVLLPSFEHAFSCPSYANVIIVYIHSSECAMSEDITLIPFVYIFNINSMFFMIFFPIIGRRPRVHPTLTVPDNQHQFELGVQLCRGSNDNDGSLQLR